MPFKFIMWLLLLWPKHTLLPKEKAIGVVSVSETAGLDREFVCVELPLAPGISLRDENKRYLALDRKTGVRINCDLIRHPYQEQNIIVFPVSLAPYETRKYEILLSPVKGTALTKDGGSRDLLHVFESEHFHADFRLDPVFEGKKYQSGQLSALRIKPENTLIGRRHLRMHWAPSFNREKAVPSYQSIAHWENPKDRYLFQGRFLTYSYRRDQAPSIPEIRLTATYRLYPDKPYFIYESEMYFTDQATLHLLRNDELTMDTLFTHIAFQDQAGACHAFPLQERYQFLEENPIAVDAPWVCFYNPEINLGIGSIRLRHDVAHEAGGASPTYNAHTRISDAKGGNYWNRRLIDDKPTRIPAGSRYMERNAYLVFRIPKHDLFKEIIYWSARLRNPLQVEFVPTPSRIEK